MNYLSFRWSWSRPWALHAKHAEGHNGPEEGWET